VGGYVLPLGEGRFDVDALEKWRLLAGMVVPGDGGQSGQRERWARQLGGRHGEGDGRGVEGRGVCA